MSTNILGIDTLAYRFGYHKGFKPMSRVRRVEDRREMEASIDEFITRGYTVKTRGETSTKLKERDWGDGDTHLIIAAVTGWWTFGLANALYAIYKYVTAEEVVIKLESEPDDE